MNPVSGTRHPISYSTLVYGSEVVKPRIAVGTWVVVQDLANVLTRLRLAYVCDGPEFETALPLGRLTSIGEIWTLHNGERVRTQAVHPIDLEDIASVARVAAARRIELKPLPDPETYVRIQRASHLAHAFIKAETPADEGATSVVWSLARAGTDLQYAENRVRVVWDWARAGAACLFTMGVLAIARDRDWYRARPGDDPLPHPRIAQLAELLP